MRLISFREDELPKIREIILDNPDELIIQQLEEWGFIQEVKVEDDYEARVFATILLAYRRSLKHKNLSLITPASQQWSTLQRAAHSATEFAEADPKSCNLRESFKLYLEIADEAGWLDLRNLWYKGPQIQALYKVRLFVDEDPNVMLTSEIIEAYTQEFMTRTGTYPQGVKVYSDMIPFVKASALCKQHNMTAKMFVEYLWDKWAWTGDLQPHQLHGKKATTYLAEWDASQPTVKAKVKKITVKKGRNRLYG